MNRLIRAALPLTALAALLAVASLLTPDSPVTAAPATLTAHREAVVAGGRGPSHHADPARPQAERAELRYQLTYAHHVSLGDVATQAQRVDGTWTVLELSPDRLQVSLRVDALDGEGPQPDPTQLERPFQLGLTDGRLTGVGFDPSVGPAARNLLTTLATAVAFTPGEGVTWAVEETDLNGRYVAEYRRAGDTVRRTRPQFLAAHTPRGLRPTRDTVATGEVRYTLDAAGVVEARIDETIERDFGRLDLRARADVEARLSRLGVDRVPTHRVARLALSGIAPRRDPATDLAAERNRIGHADLQDALGWMRQLDTLPAGHPDAPALRAGLHARLRAYLRVHPEGVAAYAEAAGTVSAEKARLMAAALGSAGTTEATQALTELLTDDARPSVLDAAQVALGLSPVATAESADALLARMDDPELGGTATLAAGSQARTLADTEPEAAEDVVETLLRRYREASDAAARRLALLALGNTGDRRIVPTVTAALASGDAQLARVAAYSLRHVPGDDVDAALGEVLTNSAIDTVRIQAVRAIELRDRARWAPTLEALLPTLEGRVMLQRAVARVLSRWAGRPEG